MSMYIYITQGRSDLADADNAVPDMSVQDMGSGSKPSRAIVHALSSSSRNP
jgi:hypothetical protein